MSNPNEEEMSDELFEIWNEAALFSEYMRVMEEQANEEREAWLEQMAD